MSVACQARLYAVFDSNVYRRLGNEAFADLRSLEQQHSVVGMASYWVAAELLSHLVDEDGARGSALNSLRRLQQHCTQYDGSKQEVRFIADGDAHLCRILFDRVEASDLPARAGELIGMIATDANAIRSYEDTLREIRDHVASEEERFVEGMWNRVVLSVLPEASNWGAIHEDKALCKRIITVLDGLDGERLLARAFVRRAASLLDLDPGDAVLDSKIDTVISAFPLPLRFYDQIVRRIVQDGLDLSKPSNANLLWDWQMSFSTSTVAEIDGSPLWLVSDDRALLSAAESAGVRSVVRPLDEYCAVHRQGRDDFESELGVTPAHRSSRTRRFQPDNGTAR